MSTSATSNSAKPGLHDDDALLTYRVGPVLCCGPTFSVVTIIPPPKLTHSPGTNIAEPGIFKHGSDIVSATDLRYRFGVKQQNWKQPGQVIITKHNDAARGYFVDEILDVIHFPETGWSQLPACLPRGIFSRTLVMNKKIYLYAEFDKLSQLQGSGYLSEYIAQLEQQYQSETKDKTVPNKIRQQSKPDKKVYPADKNNSTKKETTLTPDTIIKTTPQPVVPVNTRTPTKTTTDQTQDKEHNKTERINKLSDKVASQKTPGINRRQPDKEHALPDKDSIKTGNEKRNTTKKHSNNTRIQTATRIIDTKIPTAASNKQLSDNTIMEKKIALTGLQDTTATRDKQTTPPPKNTPLPDTQPAEQHQGFFGFAIFLLVVVLASGGGYYYFTTLNSLQQSMTDDAVSSNTSTVTLSPRGQDETNVLTKDSLTANNTITQFTPEKEPPLIPPFETRQEENGANQIANQSNNEYHAKIKQDKATITIELNGPLPPKVINQIAVTATGLNSESISETQTNNKNPQQDNIQNSDTPSDNIEPNTEKATRSELNKDIQVPKKQPAHSSNIEIIHIIVKGDTLWAIAKHYLQNPFLYPELAKLSKIKNPNLIYPGNRVRIIYHSENKN